MQARRGWVAVAGSERTAPPGRDRGAVDPDQQIEVSVVLRPTRGDLSARVAHVAMGSGNEREHLSRGELLAAYGASTESVELVRLFAGEHALTVRQVDRAARVVALVGTAAQMSAAFQVELRSYDGPEGVHRGRQGAVFVPESLAGTVEAVLGLDSRPQARPHFRVALPGARTSADETQAGRKSVRPSAAPAQSYTPVELSAVYSFPDGNGSGQTIALIELGGGFSPADLAHYFAGLVISPAPHVDAVAVDGIDNDPTGDPNGPDGEVVLDIEVVGSLAPGAEVVVYFAPNTDKGFLDAVNTAVHDTAHDVSAISISWGGPESTWTAQALDAMDAAFAAANALGISVFCASGDNGSSDAQTDGLAHADFPASSPNAVACGGTTLRTNGTTIVSETVWNGTGATGGGVSDHFGVPAYQSSINPTSANPGSRTGRGLPDVAADADPQTGYQVYVDGKALVIGGTSAVAPLWAALTARLQSLVGRRLAPMHPQLYSAPSDLRDITEGNNGAYRARPGWDACTGLGSPDGESILTRISL